MELNLDNFNAHFASEQDCIDFLTKQRWPNGVCCLHCGSVKVYSIKRRQSYQCGDCSRQFSVRTGMPFAHTKISLRKWLIGVYMVTSRKRSISSTQLAFDLHVSQKCAWLMSHKIRTVMHIEEPIGGDAEIVALDEVYIYGWRRSTANRKGKFAIIGVIEKSNDKSRVRVLATKAADATVALPFIRAAVKQGTIIHSDGSRIYKRLHLEYAHATVNHGKFQWADGIVTSNQIEGFWSHLKRGVKGTHFWVTYKHGQKYADEIAYKHNTRDLSNGERFVAWLSGCWGRTMPYRVLTG